MNADRWERITELPLTVAALVFLGFYAWAVLGDLHGPEDQLAQVMIIVTWALFAIDYFVRLFLAEHRLHWFGRHLLDLAIVTLPILRPLRLIRLLTLLAIFQRVAGKGLRGRVVAYTVVSTFLLVLVSSLAMLEAERTYQDASITTFGDALWWASTTITTVGYGDHYPVSFTGRCIAIALMVGGIALLGTIASWLVERSPNATKQVRQPPASKYASSVCRCRNCRTRCLPVPRLADPTLASGNDAHSARFDARSSRHPTLSPTTAGSRRILKDRR